MTDIIKRNINKLKMGNIVRETVINITILYSIEDMLCIVKKCEGI